MSKYLWLRYLCLILIIILTIGPFVYISAMHGGFGVPVYRSTGCAEYGKCPIYHP